MYYLLLIPLAFLLVIVFRAVAAPSPHVRIAPLQEGAIPPLLTQGEDAPALPEADEKKDEVSALLPSQEEKQTLLSCAARYAPDAFESFIDVSYPTLSRVAKTRIVGKSLYLELPCETDLLPIVCAVQMDVPDASITPQAKNPFFFTGGQFDGQYRAIAMLDALENVLSQGGQLKRGLTFVFLHDDADIPPVLEDLQKDDQNYACVLCEGGHIAGFGKNAKNRIAAVGVGVRTRATFRMKSASQEAMDADSQESALHMLAQAVLYLEDPEFPARLDSASRLFAKSALYENGFFSRILAMNPRVFAPFVLRYLSKYGGESCARSKLAVTGLHAEHAKDTCFESHADIACILAPHESVIHFEKKLRRRIRDSRVALELVQSDEPHLYADVNSFGYKAVQKAIALSFPNTNAAPAVMVEAPLAKALRPLCACTLAFSPYAEDLGAAAQCTFFENFFLQLC